MSDARLIHCVECEHPHVGPCTTAFCRCEEPVEGPEGAPSSLDKKLRELASQRLEERRKRPRLVPPDPPPRYDELWEEAMAQLDSPIEPEEGVLLLFSL